MLGRLFLFLACITLILPPSSDVAAFPFPSGNLSAAEILSKNAAARGGLQAWQNVQTLSMSGKMDAGGKPNVELPFVMELKRPRKSRLELTVGKDTAIQVFDGQNGWKIRPFLNRRDVESYTQDELKAAASQSDLDGPLMEATGKGMNVDLENTETVEGRRAYVLKVTQADGSFRSVWVDAATFLEIKIEGTPRRLDGKYHTVSTFLRDFRAVNGLQIPHVIETSVEGVKQTEKIRIEKVVVNPKLEDSLFSKPQ
jgi:outer membrane lipoprotein-sorting protein